MKGERHEDAKPAEFDDVLHATGYWGRYQVLQVVLTMSIGFSCAFPLLGIVFVGYEVPHKCEAIGNYSDDRLRGILLTNSTSVEYETCSIHVKNNVSGTVMEDTLSCIAGHNYSQPRKTSLVSEWNLICDKAGLSELSQTMLMLGQGVGGFIFTTFADKYGRKPLYILTLAGLLVLEVGIAFSPNIAVFIFIRFLIGGFQQGCGISAYTLFVEILTVSHRPLAGTIGGIVWSLSVMTLAPLAYGMKNYSWRYLQLVMSSASLYVFILPWFLDESPRWLLANSKIDQARKVTKRAARINKKNVTHALEIFEQSLATPMIVKSEKNGVPEKDSLLEKENHEETSKQPAEPKYTVFDIFRHKAILRTSAITWYIWTVNSLTYYGLFLTSSSLAGDRFVNFVLSSIVEIPGMLSVLFMLKKMGRREVGILYHFLAGIFLLISTIILTTAGHTTAGATANTVFNLLGKCAITGSFNSLFIYSPELFPTNLRTVGLGLGSAMSRVGGMTAPYSNHLARVVPWGPGALFGVLCLIASFLIRYLPETRGKKLPDTIEDVNELFNAPKKRKDKGTDREDLDIKKSKP